MIRIRFSIVLGKEIGSTSPSNFIENPHRIHPKFSLKKRFRRLRGLSKMRKLHDFHLIDTYMVKSTSILGRISGDSVQVRQSFGLRLGDVGVLFLVISLIKNNFNSKRRELIPISFFPSPQFASFLRKTRVPRKRPQPTTYCIGLETQKTHSTYYRQP